MKRRWRSALFLWAALVVFLNGHSLGADCFSLVDEKGEVITMTARELDLGDHYIGADNRLYEVKRIEGLNVCVEFVETIELPEINGESLLAKVSQANVGPVGIYHTHNAESYVPSSGAEAKEDGQGDVLAVGNSLKDALQEIGVKAVWSTNSHLPHDGQAYLRSRRTVTELLQQKPATLLDIHRDATPPEVYATEIKGQPVTKVRLVVGRQNPNRQANLEYAKRIKAVADKLYPGIIEGIFDARGNYNQDLGPKMILLEFGAHTNRLEEAEQAAQFMARVIPAAAGLTAQDGPAAQRQLGSAARRATLWVVFGALLLAIAYVLLEKGKIGSLWGFFKREAGLKEGDDSKGEQ